MKLSCCLGNNMQLYSTMYDCVTGADMFSTFLCMVHIGQVSVSMQPTQVMQWVTRCFLAVGY